MKRPRPLRALATLFCLSLLLSAATPAQEAVATGSELEQRLAQLTEKLEEQRQELHVPGFALAVVQGGEVVYSRGFGVMDLETQASVTEETLFAIGSTTKAFTASLVGMLVDEGKMSWDDEATKYLPYFQLDIDAEDDAAVTIRDLLAHRTGFTRMGLLWAGGHASSEEVLRTAVQAEPWSAFRDGFFYNNVTFLAAGMAAAEAAGKSWDDLLRERILRPLGMRDTSSTYAAVQDDPRWSKGYLWRDEIEEHELLPMRNIDSIGPAGSINSNVVDMAKWLRFLLADGQVDGKTLLSAQSLQETWSPQIEMAPQLDYGLGWMLPEPDGERRIIMHGGNIDGFSAQIGLFPDQDAGFVMLSNLSATPLQGMSIKLVADALFDPLDESGEQSLDLGRYTARYSANFGAFKNTFLTVSEKEGKLFIDVPGQTNYQLEPPNDEGKWVFSLTDQIAVSFDEEGERVVGLVMHQNGMTFEAPREGYVPPPEIPLADLQRYLGKYKGESLPVEFEAKIDGNRLAIDIPGEMTYQLHPPDDEGRWVFRAIDRIAVEFVTGDSGQPESLRMFRDGKEQHVLDRTDAPAVVQLPSVDDVLALRRGVRGDWDTLRITGKARQVHSGLDGRVVYVSKGSTQFRADTNFGKFAQITEVLDGDTGFVASNVSPLRELEGKYAVQARSLQALTFPEDWSKVFERILVTGTETFADRDVIVVELHNPELQPFVAKVDAETGDLLHARVALIEPSLGGSIPNELTFSNYRTEGGVRLAFRSESKNPMTGSAVVEIEKVEKNVELEPGFFDRTP